MSIVRHFLFENPAERTIEGTEKLPYMNSMINKESFLKIIGNQEDKYDGGGIDYKQRFRIHKEHKKLVEAVKLDYLEFNHDKPFGGDQKELRERLVKLKEQNEIIRVNKAIGRLKALNEDSDHKIGDIISDHQGSIEILHIDKDDKGFVYVGYDIAKNRQPTFFPKKRAIYQSHILK